MKNSATLSEADAKKVAAALARVLGDTYTLYLKTHGFHWNVEGPNFRELHFMLEEQYTDLWKALDELAERIRAVGHYAPGSNSELVKLSKVTEEKGVPSPEHMLKQLIEGQEITCATIKQAHKIADDVDDSATTSMLEARLEEHEKMTWMLRAQAKKISGDYVVKSVAAELV